MHTTPSERDAATTPTERSPGAVNRRQVITGLGAVAAVPLLAGLTGCGSSGIAANSSGGAAATPGSATSAAPIPSSTVKISATDAPTAGGNLSFVYMGDANQQAAFKSLFAEFNKVHPEITLAAQGIPSGNWATFSNTVATRIAGGQVPDIIQIATEGQRIFSSKGLLEPLDPYFAKDKDVVDNYFADIDPNLKKWNTQYASPDGKTYYVPGGYNTVCMYVNTEVLGKAGVEVPGDDWTWDDFTAAAKAVKEKTGAFMLPAGSGYFTDVMPWLTTNGACTLNEDWSQATYNSPAAVESATFARGLVTAGYAPKPGGAFDAAALFSQGKLAALAGGRWPTLDMRRLKMVEKSQIVPWPTKVEHGSPVGWDAWPITKASTQKDLAWTFIKFLMSKSAGEYFASIGGTIVPARLSVANSTVFTDDAPKGSDQLSKAISYATPIPSPNRGAEAQKAIEETWGRIVAGQGEAKTLLDAANTKLQSLL